MNSDQTIRLTALQMASQLNMSHAGFPPDTIKQARQFYQFLTQSDPVLDTGLSVDTDFEVPDEDQLNFNFTEEDEDEDNVLYLDDFRVEMDDGA